MSGRFNGFSQDEIHSIHRGIDGRPIKKAKPRATTSNSANNNKNVHQTKPAEKSAKVEDAPPLQSANDGACDTSNTSNESVSSLHEVLFFKPLPRDQFDNVDLNGDEPTSTTATADDGTSNGQHTERSIYQGISLKDFDSHRQMIEESNKEKKQILARALDERWAILFYQL